MAGGRGGGGARKGEGGAQESAATSGKINPLRVGAQQTLAWLAQRCNLKGDGTALSPDEMRYFVAVDGHQWNSGERPDFAAVGELDPVYQEIKKYADLIESAEHGALLIPNMVPNIGAGGYEMVEGRQTQADLEREELHSRHEIMSMINIKYPGNRNKDVRALKSAMIQAVDDKAACMLAALLDHIEGPALTTLRNAIQKGKNGIDPEYTRRKATGCQIYLVNYLLCRMVMDAPEAIGERAKRGDAWHTLQRRAEESAQEWATRLQGRSTYRGDRPPLDENSEELKQRYIMGSNLPTGAGDPMFLANYELQAQRLAHSNDGQATVVDLPLQTLTDWLKHKLVSTTQMKDGKRPREVVDDITVAGKQRTRLDGDDEPSKKRVRAHDEDKGKQARRQRERDDRFQAGTCFTCGELGHKKMDCPDASAAPSRGTAPSRSDQHIKPDKPKTWAKPGAKAVKHGASDAAVPPTFSRRERRAIAAFSAAMVEQRGKPASEVQAVATDAIATILGKTAKGKQGQPREVGDAGRAAQAKPSKAEQAYNRKMAEADDVEDEEDSD
jgi:hypothetical protein